jgi:hypothetical protein
MDGIKRGWMRYAVVYVAAVLTLAATAAAPSARAAASQVHSRNASSALVPYTALVRWAGVPTIASSRPQHEERSRERILTMTEAVADAGPDDKREQMILDAYRREDWERLLTLCSSQDRAEVLVEALDNVARPRARRLMRQFWTVTDATRDFWPQIIEAFEYCGFVSDTRKRFADEEPVVIYRGDLGDGDGISWTTCLKRAEWFAGYCRSVRAAIVGIPPEHGVPTVWKAEVIGREILGYFEGREEQEVVVRPLPADRRTIVAQGEQLYRPEPR